MASRPAIFCRAAGLPSQKSEIFRLVDGTDDGLVILLGRDSFTDRSRSRPLCVVVDDDLRVRVDPGASEDHLLVSGALFLRLDALVYGRWSMLIAPSHCHVSTGCISQ